jgi:L-threonylcarbamoyladenylate synthase
MSPWALNRLAQALSKGAVIAYPTDTIWGFGCDPFNATSVNRLLRIKQRSVDKGLILLSSSLLYCETLIDVDAGQREALQQLDERPTTWLVKASEHCPWWIRGNHDSVAIRLTDHPLLHYLCERLHSPLVSTSANRAGRPAARGPLQLRRHFADELDCIVSGFHTGSGLPSTIKSLASGTTARATN